MSYAFIPSKGTNFSVGEEPDIAKRLEALAQEVHQNVYGISGYRTPAESAALKNGSANDPHTKAEAADIGVGNELLVSAARVSNQQLADVGLWRPYDLNNNNPEEVNHVQLLPIDGGPTVSGETPPKPSAGSTGSLLGSIEKFGLGAGQLIAPGPGGVLVTAVGAAADATGVPGKVAGAAEGAAKSAAQVAAEAAFEVAVKEVEQAVGANFVKALLYLVLAGGSLALIITGISRMTGTRIAHDIGHVAKKAAVVGAGAAELA